MVAVIITGIPSVSLTSSVDVRTEQVYCSNTNAQVVFTCVAVGVSTLAWKRNSSVIEDFGLLAAVPQRITHTPFTVYLDTLDIMQDRATGNITSRLMVSISDLWSGDRIECSDITSTSFIDINLRIIRKFSYMPSHESTLL